MKKFLLTVIFILILSCAGFALFLKSQYAKDLVMERISSVFKEQTGWGIEMQGLNVAFPLVLHAEKILLKDKDTPCVLIQDITIELSVQDLWSRAYIFNRIQAQKISVFQIPAAKKAAPSKPITAANQNPSFIELFLFPIKIGNFQIAHLDIDPSLISQPDIRQAFIKSGPISIKGALAAIPRSHLASIELSCYAVNNPEAETHFFAICREIDDLIAGQVSFQESSQGVLNQLLKYKHPYGISGLLHFSTSLSSWNGDFEFNYTRQDPALPEILLIGKEGGIKGTVTYTPDSLLKVESFEAKSDQASIQGTFSIDPAGYIDNTSFHAGINEKNEYPIKGDIALDGTLKGTIEDLYASLHIRSPSVKYQEAVFTDFSGLLSCHRINDRADLQLEADTIFAEQSIHIFANANQLDNDIWNLSSIKVQSPFATLVGDFYLSSALMLEGTFEANIEDLSSLKVMAGQRSLFGDAIIKGKLYATSLVERVIQKQQAEILLETKGIKADQFRIGPSAATINVENVWEQPSGKLTFDINQISSNGLQLASLHGYTLVDFTYNMWPFHLSAKNPSVDLDLESKGQWRAVKDHLIVNVDQLDGSFQKKAVRLEDPVSIWLEPDIIDTSPIFITHGTGALYLSLDYNPQNLHLTTRLHQIPIEMLPNFTASVPLSGMMNADIYLYGPPHLLGGQIHLLFQGVKIQEEIFAEFPPIEGEVIVSMLESGLEGSMNVNGLTKNPIQMNLKLPISFALSPMKLNMDMDHPISAHLEGGGEIAPILQLFLTDMTILKDQTQLALDISGTLSDPQVSGNVIIQDGSFELLNSRTVFDHVQARIEGKGKNIILSEFSAQDTKGGNIFAKGSLELDRTKKFPFDFTFNIQKSPLLRMDFAKGTLSGVLHYAGNMEDSLVSGKLNVDTIQVKIPEQIPALTESVDVIYINQPRSEKTPVYYSKKERKRPIRLDVAFEIPGTGQIKGKDLNSQWSGNLSLTGTNEVPLWNGDLTVDYGVYNFNGKIFDINQGTINFAGDIEKKTTLYVIASRDLGEITAEVIIKGPVKSPLIAFRSNPPMTQREILSWLLFNRGISDITPFQGAQLTQSISDLNQNQKGPDLLTKLRNTTGLDRIDISRDRNSESNEMSLQVGKYISKGVFVTLNKSFGAEANRVGIEANLGHEIKVEASISDGEESDSQILLKWKHDY